jgi:hypothetical protein
MRAPLLLAATVAASLLPAAPAAAGDPIMPLGEVRAGMLCTGYSVVRGTEISSFDVEVIDVVAAEPGMEGPRILVEASGPAVDATGIGPGFSGSPILCADAAGVQRNIGAISESVGDYGGRVVLATPIEAMLGNPADAPRPRSGPGTKTAARPRSGPGTKTAAALRRIRTQGTRSLAGPLTVSGVSGPLGRALERTGERIGRPVIAVPGGPLGAFPVQQLQPGSAVSVGFSGGDLRVGAIGTVAYTDGPSVWAFGHPFEGVGARSLLLQDAYVFRVINEPNAALTGGSYKLATAGHDVGTVSNDAFSAVVGRLGSLPATTPVRATAIDRDTGRRDALHSWVADETDVDNPSGFSPLGTVAPLVIAQAAGGVMPAAPGRLTGRMCLRIVFRERPNKPARFCNRYLSSAILGTESGPLGNAVAFSAAVDALDAITLIETYEGRTPHVSRIGAQVELRRGEQLAFLRRVKAPRRVRPGQTVRLRVTAERVRGGRITRTHEIRIPRGIRPGRRTLALRGSRQSTPDDELLEIILGEDVDGEEGRSGPDSLDELLAAIRALGRWDGVRMRLAGRRRRAFRDDDLVIAGRAETRVQIVRRRR